MSPALVLAEILEAAARRARELDAQERAALRDWIPQQKSPLGPRRHVRVVRSRIARGGDGAVMLGRRALLSPSALEAELNALTEKRPKLAKGDPTSTAQRLERRLGLVGVP
jgi:hypothetical protein